MTFGVLLLGFGLGFVFVIPPGPLAVTLVEVGVRQGRRAGARSGAGIAAGDFTVGCAAGLAEPRVNAGVILASSELADEGARGVAGGRFLVQPGSYRIGGLSLEGFASPHDRIDGRRFGQSTLWRWQQGGLSFAHLGATAGPITGADKVLLGRPDVLIIGVSGGSKIFNGEEAAEVVRALNPRRVIPVQYVSGAAPDNCDQEGLQPFLEAMQGTTIRDGGRTLSLPGQLGDTTVIQVMR